MGEGEKTVLVTGVGGNVGQGVLRILRQRFPALRLVATDVGDCTAGHHFCDAFERVPYSYEPGYAAVVADLCRREGVELVIPTTDYETFYLGEAAAALPTLIASPPETCWGFIDKYETFRRFRAAGLPFAESALPSAWRAGGGETIVKPREGRGSRGLHLNPPDPGSFDDGHLVQELLRGREITTAFYVTRERRVHGLITFERALASGMTERCQATFAHDPLVVPLVGAMAAAFDIRGPCNVQSIVTGDGRLVPFEVNCRYSGTSSIRSQLGFPDVVFGIQEYLLGTPPEPPRVREGCAVRIFMDIIYPGRRLDQIVPGSGDSFVF
jgi:carbamoyl-phosphate synthase large subunit